MEFSSLAVCIAFVIMAASNYLAQKKFFGGKDNKELSDTHPTYVSPDGPTFAIWGFIYLFELLLVIVQFVGWSPDARLSCDAVFARRCPFTGLDVRERLVLAFLANAVWLPVFNNESFFGALSIMGVYFGLLISITLDLNAATAGVPLARMVFGTGVSMNASWILVALCVSIFFCGGELGWKDEHGVAGSVVSAAIVCILVCVVGCLRALFECEIAWAFVAAWALRGIYRMQTVEDAERFPPTGMSKSLASCAVWASRAVVASMVLGVIIGIVNMPQAPVSFAGSKTPLLTDHSSSKGL